MAAAKEAAKAVRTGVLDMDAHVTKAWEFFRRMGSPKFHVAVRPQPHVASGGAPRLQQATRRSLRRGRCTIRSPLPTAAARTPCWGETARLPPPTSCC